MYAWTSRYCGSFVHSMNDRYIVKMHVAAIALAIFSACGTVMAAPHSVLRSPLKVFTSPDGTLQAQIAAADNEGEIVVNLMTNDGHLLLREDYTSKNEDGGLTLAQAAWTSDSQFFVYSTLHAGGHQADNSPTFAFSRTLNKIVNLEHSLGYIDVSDFALSPPDVVITDVLDTSTQVRHKVSLHLGDLFKTKH